MLKGMKGIREGGRKKEKAKSEGRRRERKMSI